MIPQRSVCVSIRFTFANLQESPSGSFKRPSEYIKDGFDWVFGKLDDNLADVRAGLADMGAPVWLQNGIDQLAWNAKMSVGIVEGALNGVVGLGELIWDVATDPIGVGGAIVDGVCDGAKSAWEWGSKGDNWTKAAKDADQWLNDNPRVVGNVTGEVLLEVGAAALTGGSSLGASAVKKGAKELAEETLEQTTKKVVKEGVEEALEEGLEQGIKKNLPEVITKKGGGESLEKAAKENVEDISTKMKGRKPAKPEYPVLDENGNLTEYGKWYYERPSGYRKGIREKAYDSAKKSDGKVLDPLTKEEIQFTDQWDMGHKPSHEFRKHQKDAAEKGLSRKEFIEEHNNPKNYRPETLNTNRSHKLEDKTDDYK